MTAGETALRIGVVRTGGRAEPLPPIERLRGAHAELRFGISSYAGGSALKVGGTDRNVDQPYRPRVEGRGSLRSPEPGLSESGG